MVHLVDPIAVQHRPCNTCNLVGQRGDRHVRVSPLADFKQPFLQWVIGMFILPYPDSPCSLDEQTAQITVAALADTHEPRGASGRYLPWDKSSPGGKISSSFELATIAHAGHDRCSQQRPDARNGLEAPAKVTALGQLLGTRRSRALCNACTSICSSLLTGTKRMVGIATASAMASASLKSFF